MIYLFIIRVNIVKFNLHKVFITCNMFVSILEVIYKGYNYERVTRKVILWYNLLFLMKMLSIG